MSDTAAATRPAGNLQPGDRVLDLGSIGFEVREVRHVEPIEDRPGLVVVVFAGGHTTALSGKEPVRLATDEEITAAVDTRRRTAVARALRELAEQIEASAMPVPRYTLNVSGVLNSRADLQRWAEATGKPIEAGGTAGDIPVVEWRMVNSDGPDVEVRLQAAKVWDEAEAVPAS